MQNTNLEKRKPLRALLLAAGLGTRLRPFTDKHPKCLAPLGGKPILGVWLDKLAAIGCEEVLINTHYFSDQVVSYLNGIEYSTMTTKLIHEPVLLGTAGTLKKNLEFFEGSVGMIIHADNAMADGLAGLLASHAERPKGCMLTMLTFTSSDPESCGIVRLDANGRVLEFYEKTKDPPGRIANGAIFVFEEEFSDLVSDLDDSAFDLSRDVVSKMKETIYTHHTDMPFLDIGTPERLAEAQVIWSRSSEALRLNDTVQ